MYIHCPICKPQTSPSITHTYFQSYPCLYVYTCTLEFFWNYSSVHLWVATIVALYAFGRLDLNFAINPFELATLFQHSLRKFMYTCVYRWIRLYMYICMHICMHVCIHLNFAIHPFELALFQHSLHQCIYIHMCEDGYADICMYICMYVDICMYICMYVYMYVCIYVCMDPNFRIHTYIWGGRD